MERRKIQAIIGPGGLPGSFYGQLDSVVEDIGESGTDYEDY